MALLQLSFSGAVMIAAVAVIRTAAINRLPKKIFLILWEICMVRLLLPVSIPSVFSVYSLISRNAPIRDAVTETPAAALLPSPVGHTPLTEAPGAPAMSETKAVSALVIVYCIGLFLLAACFLVSYVHCRMEFRTSLPASDAFAQEWLRTHPLRRRLTVRTSDRIAAPLTYGILRPVILLPRKTNWSNETQLQYVLTHEYIHICRWDALTKLIAAATLCIHWFNPLVWLMFLLFNRDIELSCDECLIRRYGSESRSSYALTLIDMEEEKSGLLPLYNSFSKHAIEERITAIMKTKKLSWAASFLGAVVLITVVLIFATSAKADISGFAQDSEAKDARDTLTSYLTARGELRDDMTLADGTPVVWDMETAKEISPDGFSCYAFDLRFPDDADTGETAGSYAVSADLKTFYHYSSADDLWEAYPVADGLSPSRDRAARYPVCGIIRGMTEDTLTVDVVEFITGDDTARIEALGLSEMYDMPDGYYINMDDPKRETWKLTDQTSYTFIDWGREFSEGWDCVTMDRTIFETYLSGYPPFDEMRMPFFFKIEDGVVKGIFEYPLM